MKDVSVLSDTARTAPSSSGVYLWRNSAGTIIYIGKAKNLKNRLSSYFSGKKDIKTQFLVSNAAAIEYITTNDEFEALILENNLIKQHRPRYNISLKDDTSYPVLRITREPFPRMFRTRRILQDGSRYFGPFPNIPALIAFIDAVELIFPLRHCGTFKKRGLPCLYYHIGRCSAPCSGKISQNSYNEFIEEIVQILETGDEKTREKLEGAMKKAAGEQNFEKAARLRDGLNALGILRRETFVQEFAVDDRDYIAWYREEELVSFAVLKMRGGKLVGRDNYRASSLNDDEELIGGFLMAYYTSPDSFPPKIIVQDGGGSGDLALIRRWFAETFQTPPAIGTPRSFPQGEAARHQAALNMTRQNAREDILRRLRERGDLPAMEELRDTLSLQSLPVRIEGFDIAHLEGKFPVASLVSFLNGNPDKKNYRYFRLRTTEGIIDDFASMREALARRYTRLLNEQGEMPDLIVVDGGAGQVNAAFAVLNALSLDIPVIGLAKKNEEIYLPHTGAPLVIPRRSAALRLLQRVRDETHRFATGLNNRLRAKETAEEFDETLAALAAQKKED
ncbi:MAG: excinuclease ABC subunit UvrC [Spirochaetaceae bacterium]|jgi:excinuclease ABC subunit C|nr:excinuclease ABC subunit UvrC [Spirochaetaceae bacterium]